MHIDDLYESSEILGRHNQLDLAGKEYITSAITSPVVSSTGSEGALCTGLAPSVRASPLSLLSLSLCGRVGFGCYVVFYVSSKLEPSNALTYFGQVTQALRALGLTAW